VNKYSRQSKSGAYKNFEVRSGNGDEYIYLKSSAIWLIVMYKYSKNIVKSQTQRIRKLLMFYIKALAVSLFAM